MVPRLLQRFLFQQLFVAFGGSSATARLPEPSAGASARSLRWFLGYCNVFSATSTPPPGRVCSLRSKRCGGRRVDQGIRCCCAWVRRPLFAMNTGVGPQEQGPHHMLRQAGREGCQQRCRGGRLRTRSDTLRHGTTERSTASLTEALATCRHR